MSTRETARTPRQVFGAMLRYYRERAGLSRTELARQISKSVSLIQAIELGQRAATAEVTEDLERVLSADGALTRLRYEIGDGLGICALGRKRTVGRRPAAGLGAGRHAAALGIRRAPAADGTRLRDIDRCR